MATFTKNDWITGEIITANGLNGAKGFPVLEIGENDWSDSNPSFEIEIETELNAIDFAHLILVLHQEGEITIIPSVTIQGFESSSYYMFVFNNGMFACYYYPETGILTTVEPEGDVH